MSSVTGSTENFEQALYWLNHGDTISVSGQSLKKDNFFSRTKRSIHAKTDRKKTVETAQFIMNQLSLRRQPGGVGDDAEIKKLAERFLQVSTKKKTATKEIDLLDRQLHSALGDYTTPSNKKDFARWKQWGFNSEIFQNHFEFAKFLLETPLGSQMKIFNDPIVMKGSVPGIIVEGEWASIEQIKSRFEASYSAEYSQKFIVDKHTKEIYTFLDNGRGLQKHCPYGEEKLTPIVTLNEEEYARTLDAAQKFVRTGESSEVQEEKNEERTFILQIVSSYVDGTNINATKLLTQSKHVWLRLIAGKDDSNLGIKKGEVFEIGYEWDSPYKLPALTTKGRFRSEDIWNYVRTKERLVTNIAITQDEMHKIVDYTLGYKKEIKENGQKIAFNYFRQNCSAFVHYAAKQAGIKVPTKILLTDVIKEISPDWMKAIGRGFLQVKSGIKGAIKFSVSWLPNPLLVAGKTVVHAIYWVAHAILDAIGAASVSCVSFFLGGAFGQRALAFTKNFEQRKKLNPTLLQMKNFFSMKKFYYHLPGKLQKWQRAQKEATVIYKNPVKFTAVVPVKVK